MAQKQTLRSRIFDKAESIIPTEFYDVREEIHPKAGWFPMFGLTTIVYIFAVIAFALLFVNEQNNTSVETIITSYDYDGEDGYTCQMISYASATVTLPAAAGQDPSMEYNLVDIMESKTECENNFAEASPCTSHPLTFFPGDAPVIIPYQEDYTYGAVALYGDDISFYWATLSSDPTGYIVPYNKTDGKMDETYYQMADGAIQSTTSLAVDRDGSLIYVSGDNVNYENPPKAIFRSTTNSNFNDELYSTDQQFTPTVLNDNLYNIYMFLNNTFSALDVYSYPVTNTVLFTLDVEENIEAAAVYHDGITPTVYYITPASYSDGQILLFTFRDGVTNSSVWVGGNELIGLAVDGFNRLYGLIYTTYDRGQPGDYSVILREDGNTTFRFDVTVASQGHPPGGFGINPSGNRIMVTSYTPEKGSQFGYIYPLIEEEFARNTYYLVLQQKGFGGGWFTCENQVVPVSKYTPGAIAEYPQACDANGVVGQIVYNNKYLFNSVDMQTYATTNALHYCSNLYAPITAKVSKLPPYSCSRTLHQSFLSCFGTAFANMTFLMQLLVFAFAMWLPKLAERYPVQEESAERKSVSRRKSVTNGTESNGQDVEMTNMSHDVENPIQSEQ